MVVRTEAVRRAREPVTEVVPVPSVACTVTCSPRATPDFQRDVGAAFRRPGQTAVRRLCAGAIVSAVLSAALPYSTSAQSSRVRGLYNWIHSTGDAERSFAFYHDLFGVELSRSPFAGPAPADAPPERIRPVAEAGSDPLVWDLTNTHGSRFRSVFMRAPNTSFGLEVSEFFDVPRGERPPNPWDPGAATLVFTVRDLDALVSKLKTRGAPVVTRGGSPIDTPGGRAILLHHQLPWPALEPLSSILTKAGGCTERGSPAGKTEPRRHDGRTPAHFGPVSRSRRRLPAEGTAAGRAQGDPYRP